MNTFDKNIVVSLKTLSEKTLLYANFLSWCVENSTLRKYDKMTYFKQKIFFNVELLKSYKGINNV
ncbi:MAG: Unknown protein [uncultured Sulfurovum sp.]|uniref:Uncharacterized protein n=1 Tax=uncultured Sulfurovum sp. TaxID=269237 RepID=A0A6S6TUB6_9BACT|nr:MAG: Unknown protein [uncultured Sulfurovum sp.]